MALLFEAWLWPPAVAPVSITGQLRSLCLAARHICLSRGRRLSIYSQMSVFTSRLLTADAEQCVTGFGKCDEKKTLEEKSIDRRNVWLTKISESEAGAEGHLIIFWQLFRLKFKGSQMVHLFICDIVCCFMGRAGRNSLVMKVQECNCLLFICGLWWGWNISIKSSWQMFAWMFLYTNLNYTPSSQIFLDILILLI